jgi:hypothetical protein
LKVSALGELAESEGGPVWGPGFRTEAEARTAAEAAFVEHKDAHDWATPGRQAFEKRLEAESNPVKEWRHLNEEYFGSHFVRLNADDDHETPKAVHFGGCSHKDSSCHSDRCGSCWSQGYWVPKSKLFFDQVSGVGTSIGAGQRRTTSMFWTCSNTVAIDKEETQMGSTESVLRNLEALQYQMHCQAEFARSGLELATGAIDHWRGVAVGFKSDCAEAMLARASVETFRNAAKICGELLAACQHAECEAEAMIGGDA